MSILIDSYSESNGNLSATSWGSPYTRGQSFYNGSATILDSIKFALYKSGTTTGIVYARLRTHSGTFGTSSVPTGDILATSAGIDISALSTSITLETFVFSGAEKVNMTADTYYCVEFFCDYTTSSSGNQVFIMIDSTSPTHEGNYYQETTPLNGYDMCFYVYGEDVIPTPVVGNKYPLPAFRRS